MIREPGTYGKGTLSYNSYLKVDELLKLQTPLSQPSHHDEMLFIIIHQAYELWFALILHEMRNVILQMEANEVLKAHHFMIRIVSIMKLLIPQIHILETMAPVEFLKFRDRLNPASGFQSVQFREMEFRAGLKNERYLGFFENQPELHARLKRAYLEKDLREGYYEMLVVRGFKLPPQASQKEAQGDIQAKLEIISSLLIIYRNSQENLPLYLLTESFIEFDEYLALWREHHVRVVERIIGNKIGTGGSSGVQYLQTTSSKKCFPCLWELRTHLEKN